MRKVEGGHLSRSGVRLQYGNVVLSINFEHYRFDLGTLCITSHVCSWGPMAGDTRAHTICPIWFCPGHAVCWLLRRGHSGVSLANVLSSREGVS